MDKIMRATVALALIMVSGCTFAAVTVTASRDYVDRKTTLTPVTNDGQVVGYVLGSQTNIVLSGTNGAMSNVSGLLYGAAAYPSWDDPSWDYSYPTGAIVSCNGRLYRAEHGAGMPPFADSNSWVEVTIGGIIEENEPEVRRYTPLVGGSSPTNELLVAMNPHVSVSIAGERYVVPTSEKVAVQLLQKASITNLPYAITVPGEGWTFSGSGMQSGVTYEIQIVPAGAISIYMLMANGDNIANYNYDASVPPNIVDFSDVDHCDPTANIIATRGSILFDRACNLVSVSSATSLIFPNMAEHMSRDFILNMQVSGGSQPVAFHGGGGESIAWAHRIPPGTFEEGTNILRFTEVSQGCFLYQRLPAVAVVAPSTNAPSGAAADAKAVGNVFDTGFTEWEFVGIPQGHKLIVFPNPDDPASAAWMFEADDSEIYNPLFGSKADATKLVLDEVYFTGISGPTVVTATRHLVTPTRTSQLANDGTNGVPFITINDIPPSVAVVAPSTNAAAGTAADARATGTALYTGFTEWVCNPVSVDGKTVIIRWDDTFKMWYPSDENGLGGTRAGTGTDTLISWESWQWWGGVPLAATRHLVTPTKTSQLTNDTGLVANNVLSGRTYDFSRNYDIIKATADLIQLLGGTVTNNPTANGGN